MPGSLPNERTDPQQTLAQHIIDTQKLKSTHGLFQAGKLDQAEALCQDILKSTPRHFDALHMLGVIKAQQERLDQALDYLDQALQANPNHAEARKNRGVVVGKINGERIQTAMEQCRQGELTHAEKVFQSILEQDPDNFDALQLLGTIAAKRQQSALAVEYLDRAIALKSDYAEAHNNRGVALRELKRFDAALASYERAIALRPDYAEAHNNRGVALRELKRFDEALASYEHAIALRPDYAEAHSNRGFALQDLKRLDEALASHDQAIALRPDLAGVCTNRGIALENLKRFDEALASYERAIELMPGHADAHWNESLLRLLMGNFEAGWQKYEWRWKRKDRTDQPRAYPQPLWLGDADLRGRRILLWSEQGYGDTLQFCRYVAQVAALGAAVILEAPTCLASLLKSIPGVAEFVKKGETPPPFDFHCPLASLPLAFKATLGSLSGTPYLSAPPEFISTWRKTLGTSAQARVGLAWSGSMEHKNDHNRSIPLSRFSQALVKGIDYIRLQTDIRPEDAAWLERHSEVRSFDAMVKDFGDTAALIEALDLVITVDTSVAHLAGALGKEVWILLPFVPDWRWQLDRSDNPWYNSATLFRQPVMDDWDSVLRKVGQRLAARFAASQAEVAPPT